MTKLEARLLQSLVLISFNTIALLAGCSNSAEPTDNATDSTEIALDKKAGIDTAISLSEPAATKFKWTKPVYDTTKQYIYLTFDDGPQNGTMTCYNICRSEGVKATFFMVGQHVFDKRLSGIVDTIRASYPQSLLANHSYTHANGHYQYFYSHPYFAQDDFLRAQTKLNVPYKIIRLPGNSAWVREGEVRASKTVKAVCNLLDSAGYNVAGWDVEWNFRHTDSKPVQSVSSMMKLVATAFERKETHTKNHLVILTHDRMFRHPADADSLRLFIAELKKNPAYEFETIDNYPGQKTPVYSGH
ncbi:polysaccharide deacetylase family protein [Filimonas effusa]|uniref:polysaccharide deacetylase family protein n=1 Tax=Filimonas effusa TaxID=2508721 RepID=UPI0013E98D18|nr:polysaccharide deacetylase family protein [Filimonas effusa]